MGVGQSGEKHRGWNVPAAKKHVTDRCKFGFKNVRGRICSGVLGPSPRPMSTKLKQNKGMVSAAKVEKERLRVSREHKSI